MKDLVYAMVFILGIVMSIFAVCSLGFFIVSLLMWNPIVMAFILMFIFIMLSIRFVRKQK